MGNKTILIMLFTIKFGIFLFLAIISVGLIMIGSRRYKMPMRLIFGRKRLKKKGADKILGAYLVVTGCALALVSIMVLF